MKIRTCPDFKFLFKKKKFGLVQIFIYQLNISNLDLSRFEIFDWKFQIRTCPDLNYGHVRIFFFSIENLKSGLVQISILDFRFSRARLGRSNARFTFQQIQIGVSEKWQVIMRYEFIYNHKVHTYEFRKLSQPQINLNTTSTELGLTWLSLFIPHHTTTPPPGTLIPSNAASDHPLMLPKHQHQH